MTEQRSEDIELLNKLLDDDDIKLAPGEQEAFADMRHNLVTGERHVLSGKQRDWVKQVAERFAPTYENLVSSGKVPRGAEVPEPEVLKHRPLKPPPRRTEED
jgi:hypothetical protein